MRPTQIATATANVHVRTGPDTSYPALPDLPLLDEGEVAAVLSVTAGGWALIQEPYSGLVGYASADYLAIQTVTAPLFLPDLYWKDADGEPQLSRLFIDPRFCGAILKATQGTSVPDGETQWFLAQWQALETVGGDSYGQTWFRGAYHFLMLVPPSGQSAADFGKAQADAYLTALANAGGLAACDLPPIVDVENNSGSGSQSDGTIVSAIATAWAEAVQAALGRKPMLYRRYNDSDWPGLTSQMGCSYLWAKRYNDTLGTISNGFTTSALWQYTDGSSNVDDLPSQGGASYPYDLPGIGYIDVNTVTYGAGTAEDVRKLIADSQVTPPPTPATTRGALARGRGSK